MMSSRATESGIRALAEGVRESRGSINNLADLLDHLQSPRPKVVKWSCEALARAYEYLIQSDDCAWLAGSSAGQQLEPPHSGRGELAAKFREWLRKNYSSSKERLLELLTHESRDVQEAALDALLSFVKAEGTAQMKNCHSYSFPNSLLHQVTGRLLDDQNDTQRLIGHFNNKYLTYDDVRYYWMKNIASVLSFRKRQQKVTGELVENGFSAVQSLCSHMLTEEDDSELGRFFAGQPSLVENSETEREDERKTESEGEERGDREVEKADDADVINPPKVKKSRSQVRALHVQSLQKHKKQFSDAWLTFLTLPLSSLLHKKVLVMLHSDVMPHLTQPRLLLDFLTDSYDTGGVVSLLALNGLFALIHQYHLDYPDFYQKLYELLEPSVFHVKFMPRFFSLMDTFLSSTHLPLYMVAAFAKKVARLTLSAPPQGVMVGVVLVINLLKRHPNCRVLLHRSNNEGVSLERDPFLVEERDLSKCQALESCLWEIQTLKSHYCPEVAVLVSDLLKSVEKKSEEPIGKYLDRDFDDMLSSAETKLTDNSEIPLNYQIPAVKWGCIQD